MKNSLDIFIIGSIITSSLAIISIIIFSKKTKISFKWLIVFYLTVLNLLNLSTLILSNYKYVDLFRVGHLLNLLTYTLFPITYIYIKGFTSKEEMRKKSFHFIPLAAAIFYCLIQTVFNNYFIDMSSKAIEYKLPEIVLAIIYIVSTLSLLKGKSIKDYLWLYLFFAITLALWLIKLKMFIILLGERVILAYSWNMKFFNVVSLIFLGSLLTYLLRDIDQLKIKVTSIPNKRMSDKILNVLKKEELYRDIDLNLGILANKLGVARQVLSNEINSNFNMSYYQLINKLRIEKCLEMMNDPDNSDLSITDYQYELGYSSKSSFFKSFKEITETTPLKYKKSISGSKSTTKQI